MLLAQAVQPEMQAEGLPAEKDSGGGRVLRDVSLPVLLTPTSKGRLAHAQDSRIGRGLFFDQPPT